MRKFLRRVLMLPFLGFLFLVQVPAHAQTVKISAVASQSYAKKADAGVKDKALQKAKLIAVRKHIARQPRSLKKVYRKLTAQIRANLEEYVIGVQVQKEKDDKEAKTYKVAIIAEIDPDALQALVDAKADAGTKLSGTFGFFAMARVQTSVKRFDTKRTKISAGESAESVRETSGGNQGKSVDAIEKERFSKTQTGGSKVRKRDKIEYEPSAELSESLTSVFKEFIQEAGFEPESYEDLEGVPMFDELIDEGAFRKTGKLPSRVRKQYRDAARDEGWDFWGEGITSVGLPVEDNVRGNLKLTAIVSFKVYMRDGRKMRSVADVRNKIITVRGDEQEAMQEDALNKAAEAAVKTITGKLQAKAMKR